MKKPKTCILRTAGTNCDRETAFAFAAAGALVESVHINQLVGSSGLLDHYQILAIPGGFSYGDDVAAGKIQANELRFKLKDSLQRFIDQGKLIIGICNGFQVLVKAGILPGDETFTQEATLTINDSGKFEDRWVYLRTTDHEPRTTENKCIWTKGLPEMISLPVAHGEGKFLFADKAVGERLKKNRQVVFRYCDERMNTDCSYPCNPNGSQESIAGICDASGRILGLMPHPERNIFHEHHPHWSSGMDKRPGDGMKIFQNGVNFAKNNF
jgi:phosphoribosylformylglycinamidine synthase